MNGEIVQWQLRKFERNWEFTREMSRVLLSANERGLNLFFAFWLWDSTSHFTVFSRTQRAQARARFPTKINFFIQKIFFQIFSQKIFSTRLRMWETDVPKWKKKYSACHSETECSHSILSFVTKTTDLQPPFKHDLVPPTSSNSLANNFVAAHRGSPNRVLPAGSKTCTNQQTGLPNISRQWSRSRPKQSIHFTHATVCQEETRRTSERATNQSRWIAHNIHDALEKSQLNFRLPISGSLLAWQIQRS